MAEVTVESQPSDFDSSYGELKYELKVPASGSGVLSSVVRRPRSTLGPAFMISPAISLDAVGSEIVILNTNNYDGVYTISAISDNGTYSTVSLLDATFNGDDSGNFEFNKLNLRVVSQLWVNGSFFIEKTRFINNDSLFVFDFAKEMQVWARAREQ